MAETKSNLRRLNECKREIEMEIPASEVTNELQRIVSQFSNRAKIKGFRPGRVPHDIVKRMYYAEIKESLVNSLVPKALGNELKLHNLNPVSSPVINDLSFDEGQPLKLRAQFDVWPEFNLPEYKNVKVLKKQTSVTAKEINQTLEDFQTKSTQYMPIEGRGVVDGDYVVVELQSKDTKTKRMFPKENIVILAGHPENEKILDQNLKGLKPGEEKNFNIGYDKEHQNEKLAGKEIGYFLKVISIKEKKLPEINDDFAKDLGEYANLKDLKTKIKTELKVSKENVLQRELAEEIVKKITDKLEFDLPETIVEQESLAILGRLLSSQPQQPLKKEDVEKLKGETKKKAKQNLKTHLILKKIGEKENLSVTEKEIADELNAIAKANNLPLAKVIDSVNKEGKREEIKDNLLLKKTVDFLVEHAIID